MNRSYERAEDGRAGAFSTALIYPSLPIDPSVKSAARSIESIFNHLTVSSPIMPETLASLSDRIRLILRRDLKVAASLVLEDDTPLFGSHTDLDSLDALLLVSSIEKELGFKIPNERIGRETFRTIGTLASFLQANMAQVEGSPDSAGLSTTAEALGRLPHGESFRFITSIQSLVPGSEGRATWSVKGNEPILADHFPGDPVVPGVIIAEALAQLSGIIAASSQSVIAGKIGHLDIRYQATVKPPVEILLHSRLLRRVESLWQFEVDAKAGDTVIAQGQLTMSMS